VKDYNNLTYAQFGVSVGFSNDPNDTWYYYDGANWVPGVGTNTNFSSSQNFFSPEVMAQFNDDVTVIGDIYIRVYLNKTFTPVTSLITLGSIVVDYTSADAGSGGSGGGPDNPDNANDSTPPFSDVVDLAGPYLTAPTVEVEATDDKSGVASATLYYTQDTPAQVASDLIAYQNSKTGCPTDCFKWSFNA